MPEGSFQPALDLISKSKNILITSHTKPDGDACGSAAAVYYAVKSMGKNAVLMMIDRVPDWYMYLFDEKPVIFSENPEEFKKKAVSFDLVILVDVNSDNQLNNFAECLKGLKAKVLIFDHHITNDGLGTVEVIDTTASATGIIVYEFLKFTKTTITNAIANALFTAIGTDTGWFHFTNTDGRSFRHSADLIEKGVNAAEIYKKLYQNFTSQRFKLMVRMLDSLELHFEGRYAAQQILQSDFAKTGAADRDTENLIDECRRINSVEAAALFVELKDGRIKCSLRSMSSVDVRIIAQKYGGGGHKMAAGLHLQGPVEKAKKIIYDEIRTQLEK